MDNATITKTTTTRHTFYQVVLDFCTFDESFKKTRAKYKYKGFTCFNCNRPFELGKKIGIGFSSKGNKTFCRKCAEKLKEQLKPAE